MQARTVSAPAKINVILEVLGRRADGYHDLWSVLVLVDLCDTVTVAPRKRGILLTVRPPVVPAGPGNLAFRAAEAFFETWGRPGGAAITLRKRIPVGGGLGGGSSDAAAVLAALNAMTGRPLTRERLLDHVWGYEHFPTTRTVDTHILRLRRKFEADPDRPAFILTVHGQGYRFA